MMSWQTALTNPALQDLQRKKHWVQEEELARATTGLSRHHIHGPVLAQRYARVHAPPLIPVLDHHDHALHAPFHTALQQAHAPANCPGSAQRPRLRFLPHPQGCMEQIRDADEPTWVGTRT
jgi:hypothetical protein